MTDTPKFLPESRAFFRKFKQAKIQEYRYDLKAYENPRRTGYGRYPNDSRVSNYLSSLVNNLDDGFYDVSIPEDFSSPKLLVKKWRDFYDFLIENEKLIEEYWDGADRTNIDRIIEEVFENYLNSNNSK